MGLTAYSTDQVREHGDTAGIDYFSKIFDISNILIFSKISGCLNFQIHWLIEIDFIDF